MNKGMMFILGVLTGAAGGSAVTYLLVKDRFAAEAADEIEAYAEHCEKRIEEIRNKRSKSLVDKVNEDLGEKVATTNDPEEEKIASNEGVKKYHHNDGLSSKYGENRIFGTDNADKAEEKKIKLIDEIDEDEFLNDDEKYDKQTIDILLGDDQDIVGFWGYQTDNEDFVDRKFGKSIKELVGLDENDYDYMVNETDNEDGTAALYYRNNEIMTDFEVILHDMREEDK